MLTAAVNNSDLAVTVVGVVIAALLAAIGFLIKLIYSGIRADIGELKGDVKELKTTMVQYVHGESVTAEIEGARHGRR